jgi:hypothetical protein
MGIPLGMSDSHRRTSPISTAPRRHADSVESIPLIRHDVTGWEPDRRPGRGVGRTAGAGQAGRGHEVVLGTVKAARRPAAPTGRLIRKSVVVVGR